MYIPAIPRQVSIRWQLTILYLFTAALETTISRVKNEHTRYEWVVFALLFVDYCWDRH